MVYTMYLFNAPIDIYNQKVYGLLVESTNKYHAFDELETTLTRKIADSEWSHNTDYTKAWCSINGAKQLEDDRYFYDDVDCCERPVKDVPYTYLSAKTGKVHKTTGRKAPQEFFEDFDMKSRHILCIEYSAGVPSLDALQIIDNNLWLYDSEAWEKYLNRMGKSEWQQIKNPFEKEKDDDLPF